MCYENCPRLACVRQHPCVRRCHETCGDCQFPISNVTLPCGHVQSQVPWYVSCYSSLWKFRLFVTFSHLLENLGAVKCQKMVLKKLPYCEHSKQVACFKDAASALCTEVCDQPMGC